MNGLERAALVIAGVAFSCLAHHSAALDRAHEPSSEWAGETAASRSNSEWVVLFEGRDLGGFHELGDAEWELIDDYVEADGFVDSYLVSRESFSDFELRVEFWPSADANSGVYIRCQDPGAISAESGYEINIYDTNPNPENRTGAIIHHAAPMVAVTAGERWNVFEIRAEGAHITVRLNGIRIAELMDATWASGPIALQNNGGLIRFRNVRLRPIR